MSVDDFIQKPTPFQRVVIISIYFRIYLFSFFVALVCVCVCVRYL